jgi:riboflavin biosynthesis pyrimidine reductase
VGRRLTPADVDALAAKLYPDVRFEGRGGVVHVTAVWRPPGRDALVTLKIGDQSPESEHDFFALQLTRARADAIVVTGKVLRDEPDVRFSFAGPMADALSAWRAGAGRTEVPWLVVVTASLGPDFAHPAFDGGVRPVFFTGPIGAAVAHARDTLGARTISIEAGPTTSRQLYAVPGAVDELVLSIFEGPTIPETVRGPDFLPLGELERLLGPSTTPTRIDEPSGPWSFRLLPRER